MFPIIFLSRKNKTLIIFFFFKIINLFLLCLHVWSLQSRPTLCGPMGAASLCSPPGSSIHGILQVRMLEWVAMPSSKRPSQSRDRTWVSCGILECEIKWALGSITMNKAGGGDGIPVELFQILKDHAVKVLNSICQQIWKTQQWPQDWKRSVFIPTPKKDNVKECSNHHIIVLISHASKYMVVV